MGLETKACRACAAAKRKCERQTPCRRCKRRNIECTYPPSKPTSFVLCQEEDTDPYEQTILPYATPQSSAYSPPPPGRAAVGTGLSQEPAFTETCGSLDITSLASSWFTSLETWEVVQFTRAELQSQYNATDLKCRVMAMRRWFAQWVEEGSSPYVHSRLYRNRFPRSAQDAYLLLSSYINKASSNEQTILRLVEDRAIGLVAQQRFSSLDNTSADPTMNTLDHIARVQALLIYQFIGLYDGDIRLRHVAESHIPVLYSWMRQMAEHASQDACLGQSLVPPNHETTSEGSSAPDIWYCQELLWYSWIVAETVRRTWVVTSGVQGLYTVLQQGKPTPCPGGMMFTTRRGVWEAQSALEWETLCTEVNVGLIQTAETSKLLTDVSPRDINDFAKAVLELTFGPDRVKRWEGMNGV